MEMMKAKKLGSVTLCSALLFGVSLNAQTAGQTNDTDVATLKAQLAEQQKEIDALKSAMEEQTKLLRSTTAVSAQPGSTATTPLGKDVFTLPHKSLGDVASTTPIVPSIAPAIAPALNGQKTTSVNNPCEAGPDQNAVPPYIRLGSVCVIPIGFVDATFVGRDKASGSGIGTNFGSVPFNNSVSGNLSETRFSIQNSRLGLRVDGDWKGTHFIGYNEFDFLGTSGAQNINVTNGAVVPRLRLFWVDARKGGWEFLAGQSWSMLTPNRRGISPLPGDLFYTQVMDVNYVVGLTWTRQPGFRVLYHFGDKAVWGFSAEESDPYIGGSSGASSVTLPSAYSALTGTQLDAGNISNPYNLPQLTPDFITKFAIDPSSKFHAEVAGVLSTFKTINPNSPGLQLGQTSTKAGGGIQVGINGEIFKGLRLFTTNFWSDGDGRYLFGTAPDLIVNANGSLSLLHAGGTVDGFEARVHPKLLLFAYYGGVYVGRDTAIDTNGKPVGYGYTGSSQNRAMEELTGGFNQTVWGDAKYGAINIIGQYEWAFRSPWYVAPGSPINAHDNTVYLDIRYTLPGSIPNF